MEESGAASSSKGGDSEDGYYADLLQMKLDNSKYVINGLRPRTCL